LDDPNIKCEHKKVKFAKPIEEIPDSNLEAAEIYCLDCGEYIGFMYRKKKTVPEEEVEHKIIIYITNKQNYIIDNRKNHGGNDALSP
jgi:hypothetical protein